MSGDRIDGIWPYRWKSLSAQRFNKIAALVKEGIKKGRLDDAYFSDIARRLDDAEARFTQVLTFQIALALFFCMINFSADASISIFGVGLKKVPGINSILAVVWAGSGIASTVWNSEREKLRNILIAKSIAVDMSDDERQLVMWRYRTNLFAYTPLMHDGEKMVATKWFGRLEILVVATVALSMFVIVGIFACAAMAFSIYVFIVIWSAEEFRPVIHWSIIAFLVAATTFSWANVAFMIPFRRRDSSWLEMLYEMNERRPHRFEQNFLEVERQFREAEESRLKSFWTNLTRL